MNDAAQITTYILKRGYKYYCGKTTNLERRMKEHAKDRWQHYPRLRTQQRECCVPDRFERQRDCHLAPKAFGTSRNDTINK